MQLEKRKFNNNNKDFIKIPNLLCNIENNLNKYLTINKSLYYNKETKDLEAQQEFKMFQLWKRNSNNNFNMYQKLQNLRQNKLQFKKKLRKKLQQPKL